MWSTQVSRSGTLARRTATAVAAVALCAGVVGCSSDEVTIDDGDDVGAVASDLAETADTIVDEAEAGTDDLAQVLRDNGLDSAASTVEEIDVAELIDGEEFTFLAPSDEAFTNLSADELADLLGEPTSILDVLRNHTFDERLTVDDLVAAGTVESEAGESLGVTGSAGDVVEIDGVAIVTADIEFGEGVIHVVDEFILP